MSKSYREDNGKTYVEYADDEVKNLQWAVGCLSYALVAILFFIAGYWAG